MVVLGENIIVKEKPGSHFLDKFASFFNITHGQGTSKECAQ